MAVVIPAQKISDRSFQSLFEQALNCQTNQLTQWVFASGPFGQEVRDGLTCSLRRLYFLHRLSLLSFLRMTARHYLLELAQPLAEFTAILRLHPDSQLRMM